MTPQDIKKRANYILRTQGKAPVVARGMSDELLHRLAGLLREDGTIVPDASEQVRLVLVEHAENFKATDADNEVDVSAQQKVRAAAAEVVEKGAFEKPPADEPPADEDDE